MKQQKIQFPYQDRSLESLEGERWKPIRGFTDHYEVSSLGRIKSLARERVLHHGGMMPIPERMLKLRCQVVRNKSVGDDIYFIMTTLYIGGKQYGFSVGRLVYDVFVAPFDLTDHSVLVSYKDGDGRNLDYNNLYLTNIRDLRNASYEKGRFISDLRKPVSQFDVSGKLIAQYASMYEAGRINGFGNSSIANVVSGSNFLYKGFVWQEGHSKRLKKGKLPEQREAIYEPLPSATATGSMSLKNRRGETWVDFPGYEGLYQISNYGRIKSLKKVSEGKVRHWYPERIKKLTETNSKNQPSGIESFHSLLATLSRNHVKTSFPIARYVYHLFVKPFDLSNPVRRIYYKDGNPHNLHYTNLSVGFVPWQEHQEPGGRSTVDYSTYPFMNFSLEPMEGEVWKDIPQFDGYYRISNYGRVWALPRPYHTLDGREIYTREQVRKANLARSYNSYTGDYSYQLGIHLRYEDKNFSFKINRLVYALFVADRDEDMEGRYVVHKDGDNCNTRHDNLILMEGTRRYGHSLALEKMPRSGRKSINSNEATHAANAMPVVQYSLDGKVLNEYASIADAANANGVHRGSIRAIVQQKLIQLHGLIYRYKDTPYHGEHAAFSYEKRVTQYSLDGKKLQTFPSVKEAAARTGADRNAISKCALKKLATCGGFVWRFEGETYNGEYRDRIKNNARVIIQYLPDGKKVAEFPSANEAARLTGFSNSVILDCVRGKSKMSHGFVWKYSGDPYNGEYKNHHRGRPVTQFTQEGVKLASFPTIQAAADATGLTPDNIQKNVKGENRTAGGFVWKYAAPDDLEKITPVPLRTMPPRKGRAVVQYSLEGKKLAEFLTISDAAKAVGLNVTSVQSALDNEKRAAAGFVWRSKGKSYKGSLAKNPPSNRATPVSQYTMEGQKLQVFKSIYEATHTLGFESSSISQAVRGKLKSTAGYIWLSGDGPAQLDMEQYHAATKAYRQRISKPVLKLDLDGRLLEEYPSIAAASLAEGITVKTISSALNGKTKSAGGNLWRLKE